MVIVLWTILINYGNLSNGNNIEIDTDYGEFYYKVYDTKVVNEYETDKLNIQKGKEILMIYTCYPFSSKGYTDKRFVVYAEKIWNGGEYFEWISNKGADA